MPNLIHTRKLTCRYWALGPSCPNVSGGGRIFCKFAHYDTGKLAHHSMQRGTCLTWSLKGACLTFQCPYEHRATGVTGLFQGRTEIAIADAAFNAGFDTNDHENLFKLIWAVKRTGLKLRRPQPAFRRPPPPPHPIYPDRYRPSGVGDNTQAKRKRSYDAEVPLEFHPDKKFKSKGGKDDPIMLESDDDLAKSPAPANSSAKRRKLAQGRSKPGAPAELQVVQEMLDVKGKLGTARRDIEVCQNNMKALFDKHYQMFDNDEIMKVLGGLSEHMNGVFDGATDGMAAIDRAVSWVRGQEVKLSDGGS